VYADSTLYPLLVHPDGLTAELPGVDGDEDTDPIPPRCVPFHGYVVPAEVRVLEQNRTVQREGEEPSIQGLSRYGIIMNGTMVYSPPPMHRPIEELLVEASFVLQVLRKHPVRWWEPEHWQMRPVWYQGVAAWVVAYYPERGVAALMADEGEHFAPINLTRAGGGHATPTLALVDVAFDDVLWTREVQDHAGVKVERDVQDGVQQDPMDGATTPSEHDA